MIHALRVRAGVGGWWIIVRRPIFVVAWSLAALVHDMRVMLHWNRSQGLAALVVQPPTVSELDRFALALGISGGMKKACTLLGIGYHKGGKLAAVLAVRGLAVKVHRGRYVLTLEGKAHCLEVLAPWRSAFSQDKQGQDSLF